MALSDQFRRQIALTTRHAFKMERIVFSFSRAKELITDEYACLKLITTTYKIKLPVSYVGRVKKGISDHLKAQTNRHTPSLGGILVAYDRIHLVSNSGTVIYEGKFIIFEIQADFIIFRPEIGKPLRGVVNKYGRDYVSCLVHETFNASLPRPENEAEWIGDCVDIGYEFLFTVTYVGETFLRGTIIDDSVIVPQDEENEFVTAENELECEENIENGADCDDETNEVVESELIEVDEEIRDETKDRKQTKRKLDEMLNGGDDTTNKNETTSPRKKKKRKLDEMLNGGDDKTNDEESAPKKKKKKREKIKLEGGDDKKRDKKKKTKRKDKEKKPKSESKLKKHKHKVKKSKKDKEKVKKEGKKNKKSK